MSLSALNSLGHFGIHNKCMFITNVPNTLLSATPNFVFNVSWFCSFIQCANTHNNPLLQLYDRRNPRIKAASGEAKSNQSIFEIDFIRCELQAVSDGLSTQSACVDTKILDLHRAR